MDYYSYIFVRQDISQEQQLVQFGHVCCVLGRDMPNNIDPHNLYFVAIGVKDRNELLGTKFYMDMHGIDYVEFEEPDIGNEVTAVASMPVTGSTRNRFKNFSTLTFDSP